MKILLAGAALMLALTGAPAVAFAAPQEQAKPADSEKPICRRIEQKTATPSAVIRTKRVCHTKAEWEEIDKVDEERNRIIQREMRNANPPT